MMNIIFKDDFNQLVKGALVLKKISGIIPMCTVTAASKLFFTLAQNTCNKKTVSLI